MNLNKYDSQGFLYTAEEAAERAHAIFNVRYLCRGYLPTELKMAQKPVKPYNVGRNAKKRAKKATLARLLSQLRSTRNV